MHEELVKRLLSYADLHCPLDRASGICGCIDAREAAEAILELTKPRWIPVTERLPDDGVYVLVRYKSNDMAVACVFDRDENFTFWRAQTDDGWCADCDTEPTHWMPLPAPPKEWGKGPLAQSVRAADL